MRLGLDPTSVGHLRYQLLHRTVSALIEADRYGARQALMLVHSFDSDDSSFDAYQAFAHALGIENAQLNAVTTAAMRNGVSLRLGWSRTAEMTRDDTQTAIELLYNDALEIYERARVEVTIPRSDGRIQKYAPVRYRQQIERAYENNELIPAIARIVRKPTVGFGHLEQAGRPDLMLETLILDTSKPYHRLFTPKTVDLAMQRMTEYYERHPDQAP